MTKEVLTISPDEDIAEAIRIMQGGRVGRLPVVVGDALVGMVSLHHLYRTLPRDLNPARTPLPEDFSTGITVGQVMTQEVLTAKPGDPVEDIANTMRTRDVGGIPVLHRDRLVGIITKSDVFGVFIRIMGAELGGVRITFELDPDPTVLSNILHTANAFGIEIRSLTIYQNADTERETITLRIHGEGTERFVESLWKDGYRVMGVIEEESPEPEEQDRNE